MITTFTLDIFWHGKWMCPLVQNTREGSWNGGKTDKQPKKQSWRKVKSLFYAGLSSFLAQNKFPVDVFTRRQITVFTKNWGSLNKKCIKSNLGYSRKNNFIFKTRPCYYRKSNTVLHMSICSCPLSIISRESILTKVFLPLIRIAEQTPISPLVSSSP